jgi:hypothetical protein
MLSSIKAQKEIHRSLVSASNAQSIQNIGCIIDWTFQGSLGLNFSDSSTVKVAICGQAVDKMWALR